MKLAQSWVLHAGRHQAVSRDLIGLPNTDLLLLSKSEISLVSGSSVTEANPNLAIECRQASGRFKGSNRDGLAF